MSLHKTALHTSLFSIISNTVLAGIKFIAGFYGNSYALIADAIESSTDICASILVYLGIQYANKPADENHPYGHGKLEPLITFMVVGFLLFSAGLIAYQSIHHLLSPHPSPKSWTLYIIAGIIVWKEFSFRYVNQQSKHTHSTALQADAWHHRSDALSSLAAFLGISIAVYFGDAYSSADDWAALVAAGIIVFNCYRLFRPALSEIMDEHIYDAFSEKIRHRSKLVPGIIDTEKCLIRKSGMHYHVDLHAVVDGNITVTQGHALSHVLKDALLSQFPEISDVLIHIEPSKELG